MGSTSISPARLRPSPSGANAAIGHPDMAEFGRSTRDARSFAELKSAFESIQRTSLCNHEGNDLLIIAFDQSTPRAKLAVDHGGRSLRRLGKYF
jgi:hypothetical protein